MQMFDRDFDPLEALQQLNTNQEVLFNNDKQLAIAIENLRLEIKSQQEVIDVLIKGLDAANKANQQMLTQGLDRLYSNFHAQGQH
jgi:hypothetical protein